MHVKQSIAKIECCERMFARLEELINSGLLEQHNYLKYQEKNAHHTRIISDLNVSKLGEADGDSYIIRKKIFLMTPLKSRYEDNYISTSCINTSAPSWEHVI